MGLPCQADFDILSVPLFGRFQKVAHDLTRNVRSALHFDMELRGEDRAFFQPDTLRARLSARRRAELYAAADNRWWKAFCCFALIGGGGPDLATSL